MAEAAPRVKRSALASDLDAAAGPRGVAVQSEVHDRLQLELRFNYPMSEGGRWQVDTYFFVPRVVGLFAGGYTRDTFYTDFTAYMRIDARPQSLEALADPTSPTSPLHLLTRTLAALRTDSRPPPTNPLVVHTRLFANLYAAGVRAECRRLEKRLRRLGPRPSARSREPGARVTSVPPPREELSGFAREVDASVARMREALWAFRQVRSSWWPFERLSHRSVHDAMRTADEYMSVSLEERLASLDRAVSECRALRDGEGTGAKVRLRLAGLAREEALHRVRYGYVSLDRRWIERASDPRHAMYAASPVGEYHTYRASLLKKSVQQALYLDVRAARGDSFVRNAVGAVAAALAAIWALAAQVPTQIAGLPVRTQLAIFALAVLAYVAKDRIKAMTSEFLLRRVRTFDHVSRVQGESLPDLGLGDFQARASEVVRFVPWDEVSSEVRAERLERRTVQPADVAHEDVIHYRKRIEVGSAPRGAKAGALPEGYRIRDILRVNVRNFLVRLDDPEDRVEWFDLGAGSFASSALPKVYHVNVLVRVRAEDEHGHPLPVGDRSTHLRVVIDKTGIARVEEVRSRRPR